MLWTLFLWKESQVDTCHQGYLIKKTRSVISLLEQAKWFTFLQ